MAMSFLGNDFLPHGMALQLKHGGHDMLLELLETVRSKAGSLIDPVACTWNRVALEACVAWIAEREPSLVLDHCKTKLKRRNQPARGTTPVEVAIDEWNKMPLRVCDELALLGGIQRGDAGIVCTLATNWMSIYNTRYLKVSDGTSTNAICRTYVEGLTWILHYYMGKSVDTTWCFPWFLPPLMTDVQAWLSKEIPYSIQPNTIQIQQQEQLALVLPLESWWLLRDRKLRTLPSLAPQYWPSKFQLFTAGHMQTWECEAYIPILVPVRLRTLLTQGSPRIH